MKTITTLLLAAAFSVTLVSTAKAGEVFLSPRAQANQITRVSGTNADRNLVSGWYAGAAYKAFSTAPNMVASGPVPDVNLVSGNYLGAAAKSPFRTASYEIAPLTEKRGACH
ncbi:MAG: hypothetical protein RLY20_992 [Verrucomicrobiota bacterium]|jgi:hypothetical protein